MAEPTLPEQVTKLYDLIAGYHATHLLETAEPIEVGTKLDLRLGEKAVVMAHPHDLAAPDTGGCLDGLPEMAGCSRSYCGDKVV